MKKLLLVLLAITSLSLLEARGGGGFHGGGGHGGGFHGGSRGYNRGGWGRRGYGWGGYGAWAVPTAVGLGVAAGAAASSGSGDTYNYYNNSSVAPSASPYQTFSQSYGSPEQNPQGYKQWLIDTYGRQQGLAIWNQYQNNQ